MKLSFPVSFVCNAFCCIIKNMANRHIIDVSMRTLLRVVLLGLGLVALYLIRDVVLILLLSIVIASAIDPGVRNLQKIKLPRPLAVLVIYIAIASIFAFAFYVLVPPLGQELRNFASVFPNSLEEAVEQIRLRLSTVFSYTPEYLSIPAERLTDRLDEFANNYAFTFLSAGSSLGSSLFGGVFSFLMVIVLSFYFAVQENGIANFLKIVTPLEHEPYVVDLWMRSQQKIGRWLQGQMLLGLVIGVLVYIGLTLLGVRYALLLAFVAAIFEIIPVVGPILAAVPSVLLAFIQAPILGLWVIVLYVLLQQLENHLIYPLVVRKAVGVPPLLVIISLLVGAKLAGFIGLVLAVPIAAALVEYINDVVKKKNLFENGS